MDARPSAGIVKRGDGIKPPDHGLAVRYRHRQSEPTVYFDPSMQSKFVEVCRETEKHIGATVHAVFTEPTHGHVLMSWPHQRDWKSMRSSVKSALSRAFNDTFGRRRWFVDGASRKQVRDRKHFDHLITKYREKHRGKQWARESDLPRLEHSNY